MRTTKSGAVIATMTPKLESVLKALEEKGYEPERQSIGEETRIGWSSATTDYTIEFDSEGIPYHAKFDDQRRKYSGTMRRVPGGWMKAPLLKWACSGHTAHRWLTLEKSLGLDIFEGEHYLQEPEPDM